MSDMLRYFGLVGYPLTHSFSKKYFNEKFRKEGITDCIYENFPLAGIEEFRELIERTDNLMGLNVTIPYKEKIIPYLDTLDPVALEIGAVNTVKVIRMQETIQLKGYNTDAFGFGESLKPYLPLHNSKALILGTGGASKAVAYVLEKLGLKIVFVSRNPGTSNHITYPQLEKDLMKKVSIIVNCSPLGMFPDTDKCPDIPYHNLGHDHLLYDLIYNPEKTKFLELGEKQGAVVVNGLKMLYLQAEEAWRIWNNI